MASIHRKRLTSGEVVWELTHGTGKARKRVRAGDTRQEAEAFLKQFNAQLDLHGAPTDDVTVLAAVDRFRAYLETNRRKSTIRRYGRVLQTFTECYLAPTHPGVTRLRDLRPAHLEHYKQLRMEGKVTELPRRADALREESLRAHLDANPTSPDRQENARYGWLGRKRLHARVTPRTVNYELRVIDTFLRWAIKRNYLAANPASGLERLRIPKRALPKFMTAEELRTLFAHATDEERRLFMAILLSGMRRGEAEFLTWDDVSFDLGVILIREKADLEWQPKTDERIIPLSPMLDQLLREQRAVSAAGRWVFPNREGHRDTHILEKLKRICRRAGIRQSTVHALRHSFGAHLRMAGVSLADIADLLGHRDLATTQIYAKVQQDHLRKAVSKLTPLVQDVAKGLPPGTDD